MEAIKVETRFGSEAGKSHSEAKQSQSMRSCGSKGSRRELSTVGAEQSKSKRNLSHLVSLFALLLSIDDILNSQVDVHIVAHRARAGSPNDDAPFCCANWRWSYIFRQEAFSGACDLRSWRQLRSKRAAQFEHPGLF